MKNTLIVNLFGAPGTGKSTTMAQLFSILKWNKIDCEMASEFAKDLVWENRQETFKDQTYIFAKQNHKLFRCNGKVDVVICDSPLLLSTVYNRLNGKNDKTFETFVYETFNKYNGKKLKPGVVYYFKLHLKNKAGKAEAECAGIVEIPTVKVFMDGRWHNAVAKIYTDGRWKTAIPKVYSTGVWKRTRDRNGE